MVEVRYINDKDTAFVKTLHSRVDAFFVEENTDRRGNSKMYRKTIFSLLYFIGIYFLILFGGIENLIVLAILWGMMGLGQAFLGMNIMHDKVHGAYSSNFFVNLLLELPIVAIGVDSFIWSVEQDRKSTRLNSSHT